jgi:hypothetical protein
MALNTDRRTVDLSAFPDLAVIYLGMRVNELKGLKTLLSFGPKIAKSVAEQPDGLLMHENMIFSVLPPHLGMRQYWRDFESLERWARSLPHKEWWAQFVRDTGGTGFWHELYFMRGGMEAVYLDVVKPGGFLSFAPAKPARGAMFSARNRLKAGGEAKARAPVSEEQLYSRGDAVPPRGSR